MAKRKRNRRKKPGSFQNQAHVKIVNLLNSDLLAAAKMLEVSEKGLRQAIDETHFLDADLLSLSTKKFNERLGGLIVRASIHELNDAGLTDLRVNERGFVEGRMLINLITGKKYN